MQRTSRQVVPSNSPPQSDPAYQAHPTSGTVGDVSNAIPPTVQIANAAPDRLRKRRSPPSVARPVQSCASVTPNCVQPPRLFGYSPAPARLGRQRLPPAAKYGRPPLITA